MYTDTALRTADQAAGSIVCYVRVRQLSLPAVTHLAGLGVETHFRDEGFGPLMAPWMIHQSQAGTSVIGVGLMVSVEEQADGAIGGLLAHVFVIFPLCIGVKW